MNNKIIFSLSFIAGAAVGGLTTWHFLKTKYEELAQEEIDSVKEVFAKRERERLDETVKRTVAEGIKNVNKDKPDLKEYVEKLKKNGYVRYSDRDDNDDEVDTAEKSLSPYVIPPEQFGDNDDYDRISLTYYANGILTDEVDEIIEDVEDTVGFESLNHFGEYEDDSVFVRNDARKCDYEILLDQRNYPGADNVTLHQMEV